MFNPVVNQVSNFVGDKVVDLVDKLRSRENKSSDEKMCDSSEVSDFEEDDRILTLFGVVVGITSDAYEIDIDGTSKVVQKENTDVEFSFCKGDKVS